MSEEWDFYWCQVDDKPASVFVNLGIAKAAPVASCSHMAYVRLYMEAPRSDGLSSNDEFEVLKSIEDHLSAELTEDGSAIYVGRNTCDGCRDFFFYTSNPSPWQEQTLSAIQAFPRYQIEVDSRPDPNWMTYFGFLLPSGVELECMKNRRVCDVLAKNGDALTEKREIDHWAYFPSADARTAFIEGAEKLDFRVRCQNEEGEGQRRFGVQVWRADVPSYQTIDGIILPLFDLARESGGEYDGWETAVV